MRQKETGKWELIEERIIDNEDERILFDGISLQAYTEFRIMIDAEATACSLWVFVNGSNSTAYALAKLAYGSGGRRAMDCYIRENEDGILSARWTGIVVEKEESGSISDVLKRSLPVREVLVRTIGGSMKYGTIALYGR